MNGLGNNTSSSVRGVFHSRIFTLHFPTPGAISAGLVTFLLSSLKGDTVGYLPSVIYLS